MLLIRQQHIRASVKVLEEATHMHSAQDGETHLPRLVLPTPGAPTRQRMVLAEESLPPPLPLPASCRTARNSRIRFLT
jgi:hypothetical protein